MVSAIAILATITGLAHGQPAGEKPPGECCETKTVGGVTYTLSGRMDTKMYNCLNDCVYQKEGQTGAKFCFAMGDEKVECNDEQIGGSDKPPMEGTGQPPMEGSEKPPMEGSEKPPMEGSEKPPMEGSEKPPVGEASSQAPGCKCGVKKTDRIVGGQETEVNEYPWMAAVADAEEKFFCGGTLVASKWVVTASHCMFNDKEATEPKVPGDLRIVLGDHDTKDTTESILPRIVVEVAQIITHPAYEPTTTDNDITLLKLSTAVDLNTYTPACMANSGDDFTDKKAWTYGWGALSYGTGDYPDKLLEVAVTIVSTATCQAAVNDLSWTITEGMLCAGGVEGEDTCQGDSGGPLTVDVAGQHTLVGDVSFGHECARANRYGVYAKTSFYRQWIDTTVAAEGVATYCPA